MNQRSDIPGADKVVWDEEQLFVSGNDYFNEIEQRIDAAKRTIDVEMYIFRLDSLGLRMVDALARAAARGVKVRLLVDGIGSFGYIQSLADLCFRQGIEFSAYRALPFRSKGAAGSWGEWFTNLFAFFDRVNGRNHVKLWLFDGAEAWTGSYNVSHIHLSEGSRRQWQDFGVRVRGHLVSALCASFENQWLTKGWFERQGESISVTTDLVVISVSRKAGREMYRQLLRKIRKARKRVWIVTAYFVPNGSLLRALRSAARRGIEVKIIVPRSSDILFMPLVTAAYYGGLLRVGALIYEFLPTVLHAKAYIIDDKMFVGTSN